MRRQDLVAAVLLMVIVGLIITGIWMDIKVWNECRRIHPWWYCVA